MNAHRAPGPTATGGVAAALRLACAIACALGGTAACARAGALQGSLLALPTLGPDATPRLVVAQRAITRSWGPSEDSVYTELSIPNWRSEGLAISLSAAIPGAGQLYAGEGSGLWFALAEIAGWTARLVYSRKGDDSRDEAAALAGVPSDTSAAWSLARWQERTEGDPAEIATLYAYDRDSYWSRIASDPAYAEGWRSSADQAGFRSVRNRSQKHYHRANLAGAGLWANHVVAALDALRAARIHNLPLRENLRVKLRSNWRRGGPAVSAAIERRF